jgi:hypothetical protein
MAESDAFRGRCLGRVGTGGASGRVNGVENAALRFGVDECAFLRSVRGLPIDREPAADAVVIVAVTVVVMVVGRKKKKKRLLLLWLCSALLCYVFPSLRGCGGTCADWP